MAQVKATKKISCPDCKRAVKELQEKCAGCRFNIIVEPSEKARARYLRGPSLGALFFTQGYTFGARLYFWFILSLIPVVGIAALIIMVLFGRRLSWKAGGWGSWEEYQQRMKLLDIIGIVWISILIGAYLIARYL
ncbi:MAG: hypothetical protein ABIG32_00440 [Candidatus Uhrbacteria bacterium]|nr:hypothetical protein [Patescibacteria group bacterium]MBU1907333.1 hypothetical protein [Patescibacteria group bacterium]